MPETIPFKVEGEEHLATVVQESKWPRSMVGPQHYVKETPECNYVLHIIAFDGGQFVAYPIDERK